MKLRSFLLVSSCAVGLTAITATTVIPPTFRQLVQQAELIFQGTVTDSRSVWEGEGAQRHIETYVTFSVEDNLKGQAGTSYTIRMLGGTVGDETMEVTDTPKFKAGDREILFVEHNYEQFVPLVGIEHGRFHIQYNEQTGRDIVLSGEGQPVRDLAALGQKETGAASIDEGEAISPDDLKAAIHNQLANSSGRPTR